ncbi:hypothetical protein EO93_12855 [Methanosarcina sp. 1.H.A.2.2]|nr:hypothetical protein EO93_12855 [Methanosarcina sp. 1.H.A.2.2]
MRTKKVQVTEKKAEESKTKQILLEKHFLSNFFFISLFFGKGRQTSWRRYPIMQGFKTELRGQGKYFSAQGIFFPQISFS